MIGISRSVKGSLSNLPTRCWKSFVGRVDRHRAVAKQGFRACRGYRDVAAAVGERIADVPHRAVFFFRHHFQVGHRRAKFWIPIYQAFAAIDQTLFKQAHKHLGHGFGHFVVHGEVFTAPIGLKHPCGAFWPVMIEPDFSFHSQTFFYKLFPTQIMARNLVQSSCRSTTICVAMPAWSVPGIQAVL